MGKVRSVFRIAAGTAVAFAIAVESGGVAQAGLSGGQPFHGSDPIRSLTVRITTGSGPFDGESDVSLAIDDAIRAIGKLKLLPVISQLPKPFDISINDAIGEPIDTAWLDIGSAAWRLTGSDRPYELKNGFHTGSVETVDFDLSDANRYSDETPQRVPLIVDDITYIRLDKKGIRGWTNAPDSYLAMIFPNGVSPAGLLAYFIQQKTVQLDITSAFGVLQGQIELQQRVVDTAQHENQVASTELNRVNGLLVSAQKDVANLNTQMAGATFNVCNKILKHLPFGGLLSKVVCTTTFGPQYYTAKELLGPAVAKAADLQGQVNAAQINATSFAGRLATESATLNNLVQRKALAAGQVAAANVVLPVLDKALSLLSGVLAKNPIDGANTTQIGEWRPTTATLIVNGRDFATFEIDHTLKQGAPSFSHVVKWKQSNAEVMARSLRVNVNPRSGLGGELASGLTTPFKEAGISGWEQRPVHAATVVGVLQNPISPGLDNGVSLDLRVESIEADGQTIVLDGQHGISHDRYLRIEYENAAASDARLKSWHVGDRFKVSGVVKWDTDKFGFYEIHPPQASDITKL